ncbi:acyltransferase family protein [Leifsonia aquatica]|uniref:acyltransferase family protein n=1 Tax=Leifsonia aquatica TaxID=144185 RepID=UPI0004689173|nr:acyltransferase [Leifsonia aquatica]
MRSDRSRDLSLDVAKGFAIGMIVLGHVLRGLAAAGILTADNPTFQLTERLLYGCHLAVFALLSGLFVARGARRLGGWGYWRSRTALFLYLYVLWSLLQGAFKLAAGALVNTPVSLLEIVNLSVPEGQLWFLPWIIVATAAAVLFQPWRSMLRALGSLGLAGVLALANWGTEFSFAGTQGLALIVFFLAGTVVGGERVSWMLNTVRPSVALGIAVLGTACYLVIELATSATPPTIGGSNRNLLSVGGGVVATSVGVLTILILSRAMTAAGWLARGLTWAGRHSLAIFLASITASSCARILLTAAGVDAPAAQIIAGTAAGILIPLILVQVGRLWPPLTWLFTTPTRRAVVKETR